MMDATTLINVGRDVSGDRSISTPQDALLAIWGHGVADDSVGDTDTIGHFIRVENWILHTNSQGFVALDRFDCESDAMGVMADAAAEYDGGED